VQGSSSLQNITASVVSIGTNRVILNTNTPILQFGGISVFDSGSTQGRSGSLLWNSTNDHWINVNPSGSDEGYNSAILINGPKNTGSLGQEAGLTTNYIPVSQGEDHITDSIIFQSGSVNIGIGMTNPQSRFVLQSSANYETSVLGSATANTFTLLASNGLYGMTIGVGNSGNTWLQSQRVDAGTSVYNLLFNPNGGNVGIGTTSPAEKLVVTGAIMSTGGITGHGANRTTLSQEGGSGAYWQSYGTNTSTVGTFVLRQASSDFSIQRAVLSIDTSGAATFSSSSIATNYIASSGNNTTVFNSTAATTGWVQMALNNTGGSLICGIESSVAGIVATNSTAYATVLRNYTNTDFQIATNNTVRLTISGTGAATFASSISAGSTITAGTTIGGTALNITGTQSTFRVASNYTGGGDLLSGTLMYLDDVTNNNLTIIPSSSGTNGSKIVAAAFNGSAWRSMWEFANINSGNPNLILVKSGGNVGIGTDNPVTNLQLGRVFGFVQDINSGYIQANMASNGNYIVSQFATRIHLDSAIGEINFLTAASGTAGNAVSLVNRMQITNEGNIDTKGNAIYAFSGAFSMGGTYQTIFTSVADSVYLISVNTNPSSGDGTFGLLIAFNEGDKSCGTIFGNNILIQFSGNAVQIRSTNGSTYSVSWSATRIK
jgi:hypothetical protein